jgi:chromosome segregation ATPase
LVDFVEADNMEDRIRAVEDALAEAVKKMATTCESAVSELGHIQDRDSTLVDVVKSVGTLQADVSSVSGRVQEAVASTHEIRTQMLVMEKSYASISDLLERHVEEFATKMPVTSKIHGLPESVHSSETSTVSTQLIDGGKEDGASSFDETSFVSQRDPVLIGKDMVSEITDRFACLMYEAAHKIEQNKEDLARINKKIDVLGLMSARPLEKNCDWVNILR